MTRIWIVTPRPSQSHTFLADFGDTFLALDEMPLQGTATNWKGEPIVAYRIEPEHQLNVKRSEPFGIDNRLVTVSALDIPDGEVQRQTPAPRQVAAQVVKRIAIPPDTDKAVSKCVICGKTMKPRKGKLFCSPKCRLANHRRQIPIETD